MFLNGSMWFAYLIVFVSSTCTLVIELIAGHFCIRILETSANGRPARALMLDHLIHSYVALDDPTVLGYGYERAYAELTEVQAAGRQELDTLFVGGGGYTFPRYVEAVYPHAQVGLPWVPGTGPDHQGRTFPERELGEGDSQSARESGMQTPYGRLREAFEGVDVRVTQGMARYGISLLRVSLGVVFLWFGALKFFPGLSPAQDLATRTIEVLTFGLVGPALSMPILAAWECLIGIGLTFNLALRTTLFLLFTQMLGTLLPLAFFPHEVFTHVPYAPTLEGQYIIKNAVLVTGALVVGATVRGGRLVAAP